MDPDIIVDRRRLQRQLFAWRLISAFFIIALLGVFLGRDSLVGGGSYVGLLTIEGMIVDDREREREIYRLMEDVNLEALIIYIDSPGGSTAASEALYRAVRVLAGKKPVVAVMGGVAASGGYMVALAADRILARETSLTGSIGVVLQVTNFAELMRMAGIEHETIRSVPLKAQPNPFETMSPEALEAGRVLVQDVHKMFVALVAERRNLDSNELERLTDGRVFTGARALENGLIDAIGGVSDARVWLDQVHGVSVRGIEQEVGEHATNEIFDWINHLLGEPRGLARRLALDGLVSVWQPSLGSAP